MKKNKTKTEKMQSNKMSGVVLKLLTYIVLSLFVVSCTLEGCGYSILLCPDALRQARSDARGHTRAMPTGVQMRLEQICNRQGSYIQDANVLTDRFFCDGNTLSSVYRNVRYVKVGDLNQSNLAKVSVSHPTSTVKAITLIDVIAFKFDEGANSPCLWVHELKHVQQYTQKGTAQFCRQYLTEGCVSYNRRGCPIEAPAYRVQNQCEYALGIN